MSLDVSLLISSFISAAPAEQLNELIAETMTKQTATNATRLDNTILSTATLF